MLKNFFKVAFRNLLRNKGFSAINIFGPAIGMASAILILLWIQNEVSYDQLKRTALPTCTAHMNRVAYYCSD